jgi:acetylornithine deacetylase
LVEIPSVNPMGRRLAGPEFLETRLTSFLEAWFKERGIRHQRQPVAPGRDNLLAWYEAPASRRLVLFDVHQDTVPVDGMTRHPFVPEIEQGRLHGRGSCDVKGSMAAMLAAFARLVLERPPQSASVLLACTVDEEYTHTGSSRLAESNHGAALAIVAEPTALNLVNCHKGVLRWKLRTTGVACHSSTPHLGVNAIFRMGHVLDVMERYAAALSQAAPDAFLGPPSLSVGRIEGGQSANIVPDWCEIEVDRRLIPGEDALACLHKARTLLEQDPRIAGGFEFGQPWANMPPLPPDSGDWIAPLSSAVERATGRKPQVLGVPFGTDAGPLCAQGTPCVVFGPGDIAQAHTQDEWVDLEQVRLAAEAYYQMALAIGSLPVDQSRPRSGPSSAD